MKHIVKGHCHCGLAVSIDVLRESEFKCKRDHVSKVADVVDDMTLKIVNRKRWLFDIAPLPAKTPCDMIRPTGRHARLIQAKAETQVAGLGKSVARNHANKLLESAKEKQDAGLIQYFQFLIAEIEAV